MNGVPKLRIVRGDDKVTTCEKRASAGKCRALHSRDDRRIDRAQMRNARGESDEQLFDARRFFGATREIESCAEMRPFAAQEDDVRLPRINRGARFDQAFFQGANCVRIERVSLCAMPKRNRRHATVAGECRERGGGVHGGVKSCCEDWWRTCAKKYKHRAFRLCTTAAYGIAKRRGPRVHCKENPTDCVKELRTAL